YTESGLHDELLDKYGFDPNSIAERAENFVRKI
ncbi:MAG: hypothetical protein K0R31_689, partial [Clostridiales bacterium]|nr:hypothetical protein [Clostridiales bacterium]